MARLVLFVSILCALTLRVSGAHAADLTHLGQPVGSLVTVLYLGVQPTPEHSYGYDFPTYGQIISPSASASPFVIPDGQVFVITDAEWYARLHPNQMPPYSSEWAGKSASFTITLSNGTGQTRSSYTLFVSRPVPNVNGVITGHESLTAGIVVASRTSITPSLIEFPTSHLGSSYVILHGYFMPDPNVPQLPGGHPHIPGH